MLSDSSLSQASSVTEGRALSKTYTILFSISQEEPTMYCKSNYRIFLNQHAPCFHFTKSTSKNQFHGTQKGKWLSLISEHLFNMHLYWMLQMITALVFVSKWKLRSHSRRVYSTTGHTAKAIARGMAYPGIQEPRFIFLILSFMKMLLHCFYSAYLGKSISLHWKKENHQCPQPERWCGFTGKKKKKNAILISKFKLVLNT